VDLVYTFIFLNIKR